MEVSTVSPSPVSPTEGEDLCETDVTSVAIHSVTLLICLCGLAGNGALIGLLPLKSRNSDIFDLAVMDFLFLLFAFSSALLFLVEDVSCTPILPQLYLSCLFQLSMMYLTWGLFWLIPSIIVLLMYMLYCGQELPERLVSFVDSFESWAFFAFSTVIPVTYLCVLQELELCWAVLISMYTITLLLLAAPLLIYSTVVFIKAKWGSQQQQPKRCNIVSFLIVLFLFLFAFWNFLQQLGYITMSSQMVFLLTCIYNSIKPLVYFFTGQCWRPCSMCSLKSIFEEPEEKKTPTEMMCPGTQGSEPADPFHCPAEGSEESV